MTYRIRPGGNNDYRTFDTLESALAEATAYTALTGYSSDILAERPRGDAVITGIVAQLPTGTAYIPRNGGNN